ncbi:DUF4136 domain-containing protein [Algoriphagus sp. C2-6-M1]|uniref:DUF4136 domain-containing protein n=1 Tax=Algoriphagus persicinus TaxID=3108754 RepID=UPI002B3AC293|nr:DUF4136 domain-containing protein [Algoriphagus sp. C2-6-M1]MEB2780953.1 DUF4136 domain-containing protein [Algoriphagus sp. C2-6-M1]
MKKLSYFLLFTLFSLTLAACSNQGMKVVTRDDGSINLSNYSTYEWIADVENIPNSYALIGPHETLVFNNQSAQKMIKDAVELQMEARGFARDHSNPEMLINFTVLEKDTELRKYILDNGQDYLGFGPRSKATQMVPVDAGTVLINFMDAKTGVQIWQGYASGALDPNDIKNMSTMQQKVGAIFEDFDFNQFQTGSNTE